MCLKHLDLCSGIGGFALGLQKTGYFKTIGFCEIDPFCQKVLKKNFPGVPIYSDIKKFKPNDEGLRPDVITSGFPCQPFSTAGRQKGKDDNRNLWKETLRIIKECRPSWFIGENVGGIVKLYLDTILEDLESEGYSQTRCFNISASSIGASHQRARIWIVANTENRRGQPTQSKRREGTGGGSIDSRRIEGERKNISSNANVANSEKLRDGRGSSQECGAEQGEFQQKEQKGSSLRSETEGCSSLFGETKTFTDSVCEGLQGHDSFPSKRKEENTFFAGGSDEAGATENWWEAQSKLRGIPDGIQYGLHKDRGKRIMALGNAVCPQIPFLIGKAIGKLYE